MFENIITSDRMPAVVSNLTWLNVSLGGSNSTARGIYYTAALNNGSSERSGNIYLKYDDVQTQDYITVHLGIKPEEPVELAYIKFAINVKSFISGSNTDGFLGNVQFNFFNYYANTMLEPNLSFTIYNDGEYYEEIPKLDLDGEEYIAFPIHNDYMFYIQGNVNLNYNMGIDLSPTVNISFRRNSSFVGYLSIAKLDLISNQTKSFTSDQSYIINANQFTANAKYFIIVDIFLRDNT